MDFLKKISPIWALRLGFGSMYLYSGIDIFSHPRSWFWAAKPLAGFLTSPEATIRFLQSQAMIELLFAVAMLSWFLPVKIVKAVAGLSALQMFGIVLFLPIDAVTFRDLGLLGGAVALFLLLNGSEMAESMSGQAKPKSAEGQKSVQTFDEFMKS